MIVLRLHGPGNIQEHSEPAPMPVPGEALLRVKAVGICASDLHWFSEAGIGDSRLSRPLVLGHEFAAVVERSTQRKLTAGDRVAVDPTVSCGECEYCQQGHPNLCPNLYFAGHDRTDGAMRELINWPIRCCYTLPDSLSDVDGAMLEPLGVAIHSVDLGHLKPGMCVAVLGCGPIGLLTLQMARLSGATQLIATDPLAHRLDVARGLGATQVFTARERSEEAEILAATGKRGVDVVFEAAGENDAVETAMEVARLGGRVVLIGIPSVDRTAFKASTARRKGLTIAMVRRMKHTYPRAIRLVETGLVDVRSIVTHRFPFNQFSQAFDIAVKREGIKVVLEP